MKNLRLRLKFILGFIGLVLLITLLLLLFIRNEFRLFMNGELRKRGASIAHHLNDSAITPILTENRVALQGLVADFIKNEKDLKYIYIVNPRQELLAHSFGSSFPSDLLKTDQQIPKGQQELVQTLQADDEIIEDISISIRQGELGRIHVGLSTQLIDANIRHLLVHMMPYVVGILCLGTLAAYLFAASITRPLSRLARAARQIGSGSRNVTVDITANGEIGELAQSFNQMSAKLTSQQQQLEELNRSLEERIEVALADLHRHNQALVIQNRLAAMGEMINCIAHQWRQPLNNVALIVQGIKIQHDAENLNEQTLEEDVNDAMKIICFMSHTIDDFRNFFRQDKEILPFSVNEAVARTIAFMAPSLRSHGINFVLEEQPGVTAKGYANEYSQVVLNIISNAKDVFIERNISDPLIKLKISSEEGRSLLIIQDNGGGIDPEVMPRIFEPYFSTKQQSNGTGIGLYMSKVIMEQNMAGRLTARNLGVGAEFRIEL